MIDTFKRFYGCFNHIPFHTSSMNTDYGKSFLFELDLSSPGLPTKWL